MQQQIEPDGGYYKSDPLSKNNFAYGCQNFFY